MNIRRMTAFATLVALVLGTSAIPALAERGGHGADKGRGPKVSEQFGDMGDFGWGLDDVVKMNVKGIFNGRGEGIFAPGAKITHQETAVAVVRLMDKEAAANALTAAEIDTLLAGVADQKNIAAWARPSVAMLVKVGATAKDAPFQPLDDATRLDVAVLLVNALGYNAEAQAKMNANLHFKDAHLIPADLIGYVAVAVDHQFITGYDDQTFRPQQAVKRIEMAVMMGRADRLVDRDKHDEYKGTVKSVDVATGSFVITTGDKEVTLTIADEASIFIDKTEKDLVDLKAGMQVEVKLNSDGKVIYVEAKTVTTVPAPAVTGAITALAAASSTSLALVSIANVAYPLSPSAVITLNGQPATFGGLKVGDTVKATTNLGLVVKLEAQRSTTTVSGTVAAVTAATQSALAKIRLSVTKSGTTTTTDYPVAANPVVKLNGQAAQFSDVEVGDTVTLTLGAGLVDKVELTRAAPQTTVINGSLVSVVAVTAGQNLPAGTIGQVSISYTNNGTFTMVTYSVTATTELLVSGQAAQFDNLYPGDAVTATLLGGMLVKLEVNL